MNFESFFLKYPSTNILDSRMYIIGHAQQRNFLATRAKSGAPNHAYIFSGPDRIGKFLVAQEFARLLCGRDDGETEDVSDIFLLEPEREEKKGVIREKSIPVESVRDLRLFLSQYPARGRFRVAIVRDAEKLLEPAQNAILKTLEEPSDTGVILFVTSEPDKLLPTVRSRMERIVFGPVATKEVEAGIRQLFPSAPSVEAFFSSLGRPGLVIEALQNPDRFSERKETLRSLFRIASLSIRERIDLSERFSRNVPEAIELFDWWIIGMREHMKASSDEAVLRKRYLLLEQVSRVKKTLQETNAGARLLLDSLFLSEAI